MCYQCYNIGVQDRNNLQVHSVIMQWNTERLVDQKCKTGSVNVDFYQQFLNCKTTMFCPLMLCAVNTGMGDNLFSVGVDKDT